MLISERVLLTFERISPICFAVSSTSLTRDPQKAIEFAPETAPASWPGPAFHAELEVWICIETRKQFG